MKILAIIVFYLSTTASAAGWAGALQWVWIYFAYEIDLENPEGQRTIGMRCKTWDPVQHLCKVPKRGQQWEKCLTQGGGTKCSFNEFMRFHRVMDPVNWENFEAYRPDSRLDARQTAINLYNAVNLRQTTIKNTLPHKWIRDGNEETAHNQYLWDLFDGAHDDMVIARVGDHETYMIGTARDHFGDTMQLHTQNLGQNPVNAKKSSWDVIDWKTTVEEAEKAGVADAAEKCLAFLERQYAPVEDDDPKTVRAKKVAAMNHLVVIESLKRGQDQRVICRG